MGPRPERARVREPVPQGDSPLHAAAQSSRGHHGWRRVNGWRGNTSLDRRVECDLFYIRNWSYALDLKILTLTLWKGFVNKKRLLMVTRRMTLLEAFLAPAAARCPVLCESACASNPPVSVKHLPSPIVSQLRAELDPELLDQAIGGSRWRSVSRGTRRHAAGRRIRHPELSNGSVHGSRR
jgi:hypothetical protein